MMKHNRGCQHIEPQAENIISGYPFRVPGTQGKIGNENEEFKKENSYNPAGFQAEKMEKMI